jgi:hypothetical protein
MRTPHRNNHSCDFLAELLAAGRSHSLDELSCSLFSTIIPTAARYSQVISHIVNFYFDDVQQQARHDMLQLMHDPGAEAELLSYIHEAMSVFLTMIVAAETKDQAPLGLDPSACSISLSGASSCLTVLFIQVACVLRTATVDSCLGDTPVRAGETVFASIVHANLDVSHQSIISAHSNNRCRRTSSDLIRLPQCITDRRRRLVFFAWANLGKTISSHHGKYAIISFFSQSLV